MAREDRRIRTIAEKYGLTGILKGKLLAGMLDLAILVFLIRWTMENIDPAQLAIQLTQLPVTAFWVTLLLNIVVIAGYGLRLSVILGSRFGTAFAIVNIGYVFNSILPLRIGDLLKIYYGRMIFDVPASRLIPTSFFEKLYDLFAVFVLLLIVITTTSQSTIGTNLAFGILMLLLAAAGLVIVFLRSSRRLQAVISRLTGMHAFTASVQAQVVGRRIRLNLGLTAILWAVHILVFYAAARLFIPWLPFQPIDAISLLLLVSLSVAIPSTPAGIGLVEAAIVGFLIQRFSVPKELALATALAFHLAVTIPHVFIGAFILVRYRMGRRV